MTCEDRLLVELQQVVAAQPRIPARRHRKRVVWAAITTGAVAAAVTGSIVLSQSPAAPPPRVEAFQNGAAARPLLLTIANAAALQPAVTAREGQWVYEKHINFTPGRKPVTTETWRLVTASSRPGILVRQDGKVLPPAPVKPDGRMISPLVPADYAFVAALPTSPGALLAALRAEAVKRYPQDAKEVREERAMSAVFTLLFTPMAPPKVTAAAYRVVADLPGTTIVAAATDAAGRAGIGVQMPATWKLDDGSVQVWIFDKKTYRFIGSKSSATLGYGVVDKAGQQP